MASTWGLWSLRGSAAERLAQNCDMGPRYKKERKRKNKQVRKKEKEKKKKIKNVWKFVYKKSG